MMSRVPHRMLYITNHDIVYDISIDLFRGIPNSKLHSILGSLHLEPVFLVYAWYMPGIYHTYCVLIHMYGIRMVYTWYILGYTMSWYIHRSGYTMYIQGYTWYIHNLKVYTWYIHGYTWYII